MAVQYNLIKQDVFEGLKTLESDSYDLCIVDPPYNASYKPTDLQQQSRLSVGSLFPQYSHLPIAWKNEYMTHYAMNGICEYSYNKNHLFVQPA